VAGSSVRYRARIRPFQRFELRTRLLGWDERFIYIEQAMWRGETPCNHALMRTGVTEKGRLVETGRVAEAMGLSPASPPLPGLGERLDRGGRRSPLAAGGLKHPISSRMQR
jgi:hypothetical protein